HLERDAIAGSDDGDGAPRKIDMAGSGRREHRHEQLARSIDDGLGIASIENARVEIVEAIGPDVGRKNEDELSAPVDDVAEPLATNARLDHFDAARLADDAAMLRAADTSSSHGRITERSELQSQRIFGPTRDATVRRRRVGRAKLDPETAIAVLDRKSRG